MKKPFGLTELGRYYGYPDCCILEFTEFMLNYAIGETSKREKRKFHGTGYIPCAECDKKSKKDLLKVIAVNRRCKTKFPIDDYGNPMKPTKKAK